MTVVWVKTVYFTDYLIRTWLYFYVLHSVNVVSCLRQTTIWKKVKQMFNQLMTVLTYLTTVARASADNGARL